MPIHENRLSDALIDSRRVEKRGLRDQHHRLSRLPHCHLFPTPGSAPLLLA